MKNAGEQFELDRMKAVMNEPELAMVERHMQLDCILLDTLCALGYGTIVDYYIEQQHTPGWYPRSSPGRII